MSDDAEKPFDATPQRINRARREGDVARASELPANLAFVAAALATAAVVPWQAASARLALVRAFDGVPLRECAGLLGAALAPLGAAALAGTLASALQGGGWRFGPVTAKLERLDPFAGGKRILSRETLGHGLRAALAFALAGAAMLPAIAGAASPVLAGAPVASVAAAVWNASARVVLTAAAVGALFAAAEFAAARGAWLRKLRMSLEERRREAKEQEGDPVVRGRRRAFHRSLLRGALAAVKDASFVVVNPTHVAVALEYRPPAVPVPRVLVRAADTAALRVREVAVQHRVPIVEEIALARALYRDARVGDAIPHAHYVAVAEIVARLAR